MSPFAHAVLLVATIGGAGCGGDGTNGADSGANGADSGGGPDDDAGTIIPPGGTGRIVGYFAAWAVYGRDYHVTDIAADKLTHINYAFANIGPDGRCVLGDPYADIDKFYPGDSWDAGALRGNFHQLQLLKQAHPGVSTLISVGGWTWSGRFSDVALSDASRTTFAASCVDFITQYGFDGVDIDWEFPDGGGLGGNTMRPEDPANYLLLLQALRAALDARGTVDGRHYLLTVASSASPSHIAGIDWATARQSLDWINIMTYDFHGSWDATTGFNAPLYTSPGDPGPAGFDADSAVDAYLALGIPADALVLGVPFYGRGWAGVADVDHGLFQPSTSIPQGTWEAGMFDYHDLAANYVPTMTRWVDDTAKVPWLYDPARQLMISYDDAESIGWKADYINAGGLGGAMIWELSGDTADAALLDVLHTRLVP